MAYVVILAIGVAGVLLLARAAEPDPGPAEHPGHPLAVVGGRPVPGRLARYYRRSPN